MKTAVLFSGGKDSTFALDWAVKQKHSIKCLITLKPKRDDSYMFHVPNIELAKLLAQALEIPILFSESSGIKEKELEDLEKAIDTAKEQFQINAIVAGALASNYQKDRVVALCKKHNIEAFAPFWHHDPEQYMKSIVDAGFEAIITGIAAHGLDESWLGRKISHALIDELVKLNRKFGLHIGFEGGEAESLVVDCPLYRKRLLVISAEKIMENECTGRYIIREARLEEK